MLVSRAHGHQASDVRDLGLAVAPDSAIAELARRDRLCIITGDQDFGNMLDYPPRDYCGIVVIRRPKAAAQSVVLGMVDCFLRETAIVEHLEGCLAIVEPGRFRLSSS